MRSKLIRSTLVMTAALAFVALPATASDAGDTARSNPLCASGLAGGDLAATLGVEDAIPVSGCPAFCSSHSDCESACPSIPGVYCDFSSWTCVDPNEDEGEDPPGEDCPAFCSSHSDCESACPEVTGVYCDFSTWTCKN